jgi:hypothetical protein
MKFNRITRAADIKAGCLYLRAVVGPTGYCGVQVYQPVGRVFQDGNSTLSPLLRVRYQAMFGPMERDAHLGDLGVHAAPTTRARQGYHPSNGSMLVPFTAKAWQYLNRIKGTDEFLRVVLGNHLSDASLRTIHKEHLFQDDSLRGMLSRTPSFAL